MLNFTIKENVRQIMLTAATMLRANKSALLADLVQHSDATIERISNNNNWNDGVDYYTVFFTVDVDTFLLVDENLEANSDAILMTLNKVCGHLDEDILSRVKIVPELITVDSEINSSFPRREEPTFWKPGYFKLFISHLATYKKSISALKTKLEIYGISAFVAHEDIEPTKEWQDEIEHGLFTMEALCAILMERFNLSNWTDQEIGVAIGRNVLIIPVRKGMNPYGFIGKYQGFQATNKSVGEVARAIFDILSSHPKTAITLIIKLSELFLLSNSHAEGLLRIEALQMIKFIPKDRIDMLHQRIIENDTLKSDKILKAFNDLMKRYGQDVIKPADFEKAILGQEDDLPF